MCVHTVCVFNDFLFSLDTFAAVLRPAGKVAASRYTDAPLILHLNALLCPNSVLHIHTEVQFLHLRRRAPAVRAPESSSVSPVKWSFAFWGRLGNCNTHLAASAHNHI